MPMLHWTAEWYAIVVDGPGVALSCLCLTFPDPCPCLLVRGQAGGHDVGPFLGIIFSAFMVNTMIGSNLFGLLMQKNLLGRLGRQRKRGPGQPSFPGDDPHPTSPLLPPLLP